MRDYGKLYTSFWTSEDTRRLSDDGKLLAAYLLSGPHTTLIGCFRIPDGYISEDLGWTPERVSKGFRNLSDNGFVTYNKGAKWVFVHKFLKWNGIENPNQAKAAIKLYEQIPDTTGLKPCVVKAFIEFAPRINTDELKPFENRLQTLPKPGTETGTGTGTGTEVEDGVPEPAHDEIPYKEIIEYLNLKTGKHFNHTTRETRTKIKARWGVNGSSRSLQDFKTVIDNKCAQWLTDDKMISFLRPETLFGTKFEAYLNDINPKQKESSW